MEEPSHGQSDLPTGEAEKIREIIVRNLPPDWSFDQLRKFLEDSADSIFIQESFTLSGDSHTVLLTLEESVTEDTIQQALENASKHPFAGKTLQIEAARENPYFFMVLHDYTDLEEAGLKLTEYFSHPRSGAGDSKLVRCDVETYLPISVAIIELSTVEGVLGVLRLEEHTLEEKLLRVKAYCKQVHDPVLNEFLELQSSSAECQDEDEETLEGHTSPIKRSHSLESRQKQRELSPRETVQHPPTAGKDCTADSSHDQTPVPGSTLEQSEEGTSDVNDSDVTSSATRKDTDITETEVVRDTAVVGAPGQTEETEPRPKYTHFKVAGKLEGLACIEWFGDDLDKIIKEILSKGGDYNEELKEDSYTLSFRCFQEDEHQAIHEKLKAIERQIESSRIDFNQVFSSTSDRALLTNGVRDMGLKNVLSALNSKLLEDKLYVSTEITLPSSANVRQEYRHSLDLLRSLRDENSSSDSSGEDSPASPVAAPIFSPRVTDPFTVEIASVVANKVTIAVRLGDIAAVPNDGVVSPLGNDFDMSHTAVGSAFLRLCPHLQKALAKETANANQGDESLVFRTRLIKGPVRIATLIGTPRGHLRCQIMYHALLQKLQKDPKKTTPSAPAAVYQLLDLQVKKILAYAEKDGLASIAFPLLGMGRRFGYGAEEVAHTLVAAFAEFLAQNMIESLKNISIVILDEESAVITAQTLELIFNPPSPSRQDSKQLHDGEGNSDDVDATPLAPFEALVVSRGEGTSKKAKEMLVKFLRDTFLYQIFLDTHFVASLSENIRNEIMKEASEKNVRLSMNDAGLLLTGQRQNVEQVYRKLDLMSARFKRKSLTATMRGRRDHGLPSKTDRLPSYWKLRQLNPNISYGDAIQLSEESGKCLVKVNQEELAAVKQLIAATWQGNLTGSGKDACDLTHIGMQVVSVERLEHPQMWKRYSHRREELLNQLGLDRSKTGPARCTPVENLPGSRGPVLTTANIAKTGPLARRIYPQVNEHYLFHGTKREFLHKILQEGLDFRLAKGAMLGPGVYAAESATKSDQYTDTKAERSSGKNLKMLLIRMLLGEAFLHKDANGRHFVRPPCMRCRKRQCSCQNSRLYDSVVDDARLFREFVVYDQNVCYPEYIITYNRK